MALRDDEEFQERKRALLGEPVAPTPEPEKTSWLADVGLAVPRGVEAFAQDTYGLFDTIAFDALPDYDERFLGESKTGTGKLIEGVTNFAAALIPVAGVVGKLGKGTRLVKASGGLSIAGDLLAGAGADLLAFGGQEARLSDLIEEFPQLSNPITRFLESDEDDGELEGRFKNVLEGLALGAITEPLFRSLKVLKKARRGEDVAEAVDELAGSFRASDTPSLTRTLADGTIETPETVEAALKKLNPSLSPEEVVAVTQRMKQRTAEGLDPNTNPRTFEYVSELLDETDLNLRAWGPVQDPGQVLRATEEIAHVIGKEIPDAQIARSFSEQTANGTTAALEMAREVADAAGMNADEYIATYVAKAESLPGELRKSFEQLAGHQRALKSMATELSASWNRIDAGEATETEIVRFMADFAAFEDLKRAVRGVQAEAGRGLGFLRAPVEEFGEADPALLKEFFNLQSRDSIVELAGRLKGAWGEGGMSGVARVGKIAEATRGRKGMEMFLEYWYNSILSGPITQTTNLVSGAVLTAYQPLELMAGAAIRGDGGTVHEAFDQITSIFMTTVESLRMSGAAMKSGQGILNPRATKIDDPLRKISASYAGLKEGTLSANIVNGLGAFVNLPSRFMTSMDEFVRQVNFRSVGRAKLMRDARAKGLRGADVTKYAEEKLSRLIVDGQAISQETLFNEGLKMAKAEGLEGLAMKTRAIEYANEILKSPEGQELTALAKLAKEAGDSATLTNALDPQGISAGFNRLSQQHPMLRIAIPFVRTPTNIAKFAGQRLDVLGAVKGLRASRFPAEAGALATSRNRFIRELVSSDPRLKAQAAGRMAAGIGFITTGAILASTGTLTGRGPSNPRQRKALEAAGWLPYSIKVKDKYYQYNRLDPFATFLGLAADLHDYAAYAHESDQSTVEGITHGLLVSLANNITNKTYMVGLRNLVDAITDPERKMDKYIQRMVGSLVPNVSGQAVARVTDDHMREVRTWMDAVRSKIPGLSETLAPQRNLLGEPVDRIQGLGPGPVGWMAPLAYSEVKDDVIFQEMAALRHGFSAPRTEQGGIDLTTFRNKKGQDAYDRWMEIQGQIKVGKKTLRVALRQLIEDKRYQELPQESTFDVESPRIGLLKGVIRAYQSAAMAQLRIEIPEIRQAEEDILRAKREARYGRRQPLPIFQN